LAQKPKTTGFTNLQTYLKANQGAGQQIAGSISSDIQGRVTSASKAQDEANKVGQVIQDQNTKVDQAGTVIADIQTAATGNSAPLSARVGDVDYLTKGGYSSVAQKNRDDLADRLAKSGQAIGSVKERATQLGSEAGRMGVLQDIYKSPTYSSGQQSLDQMFLQQSGGNALTNLQRTTEGNIAASTKAINDLQTKGSSTLADILAKGRTYSTQASEALTKGLSDLTTSQEKQFAETQEKQNTGYDSLVKGFQGAERDASGNVIVTQELADQYKGLTGKDLADTNVYGALDNPNDIANMFKKSDLKSTDVVTKAEYDAMKLMADLGGGTAKYAEYAKEGSSPYALSSSLEDATKKAWDEIVAAGKGQNFNALGHNVASTLGVISAPNAPDFNPAENMYGAATSVKSDVNIGSIFNPDGSINLNNLAIDNQASEVGRNNWKNPQAAQSLLGASGMGLSAQEAQAEVLRRQNAAIVAYQERIKKDNEIKIKADIASWLKEHKADKKLIVKKKESV
jgi:hypothetical protein